MKYSETLWNQHDSLHDRYRIHYEYTCNLLEMISKVQYACKDYSKALGSIYSKNLSVSINPDSSLGRAIEALKQNFNVQTSEFLEGSENIRTKMLEPSRSYVEDVYYKEKDAYNDYKKSLSRYYDSKASLEKGQNRFEIAAKAAEKAMISAKNMKLYSIANDGEKEKNYTKAKSLLIEAKEAEDKYTTSIEYANKCRMESIEKGENGLSLYQTIDKEMSANIFTNISGFNCGLKKMASSILLDIDGISDKINKVNIDNDIIEFITSNKSVEVPDQEIKFIPYLPITQDSNLISDKEDGSYEVIKEGKENLKEIYPHYNLVEEDKKCKIRKGSSKIFTSNADFLFSKDQKEEGINYLKENNENRMTFLLKLNRQRISGKFARRPQLIHDIKDIVNLILDLAEKEKDYESARNCIIGSQTFYYEDKGNKIYIFNGICENVWLRSKEFWEGQIETQIQGEIQKNERTCKDIENESEKEKIRRVSNIAFSQVLPYSNNMLEFKINKDIIKEVINIFVEKYTIEKDLVDMILANIMESDR